jgi:hypothetical protein
MNPISVVGALQTIMANMPPDQRQLMVDAVMCIVELTQTIELLDRMVRNARAALELEDRDERL